MTRPLALALLFAAGPALADEPGAPDRPNVLLILTDDQGWGDIHSHGNEQLDTPNLDRLAQQGARFDRFFVSPVCAPTRAALLTGRYSLRCGVHGVTRAHETMRSGEVTIAELLGGAGYATGCFGKWHNGAHWPTDPHGQGFDKFAGFTAGHWNNYFDPLLPHPPEHAATRVEPADPDGPVRTEGYIADVFTDAALRFIGEKQGVEPWFCYVPYNTPHWPPQAPEELFAKYVDRGFGPETASAYAMVENIDRNVGRLLAGLDQWGAAEDTIVLFLTDNGPNGHRYNGGMNGRKGSAHEGGVRVPLFVRFPAAIEPGTVVTRNAAHVDLLPTLCELCGVEPPADRPLDGKSLAPLLTGDPSDEQAGWPDRRLFTFKDWRGEGEPDGSRGAVRTDRWRLVRDGGREWALFDMPADPDESEDVAARFPAVRDELAAAFEAKWDEVTADGFDPVPVLLTAGGPADRAELPAHEADLKPGKGQGVRYRGPSGWANDYLTGWTDPAAFAQWPLEVGGAGGRYAVRLLVTATPEQVGSTFAVEFGPDLFPPGTPAADRTLTGTVTEAFDPPFYPSPDRFERPEAYEKPWAALDLGTVRLAPGVTPVRLRAVEKPGGAMPEVKAVRLLPAPAAP